MSHRDLTCREVVELVNDYLAGDLPPVERARFQRHLDACPGCAVYLEQMRRTIAAVGRLGADALEPDARDDLVRAFGDWRCGSGARARPR